MPFFLVPVALAGVRAATDPRVQELMRNAWQPPGARFPPEQPPPPGQSSPPSPGAHAPSSAPGHGGTVVPLAVPRARGAEFTVGRLERIRVGERGTVSPTVPNLNQRELRYMLRAMPGRGVVFAGGVPGTSSIRFPGLDLVQAGAVLEHVQALGLEQYRRGEARPVSAGLNDGRLRYTRWDPHEEWRTPRDVWRFGEGDCDDLAPAVAAELQLSGIPARAILLRSGPKMIHAVAHRLDTGEVLDPSITGGMLG